MVSQQFNQLLQAFVTGAAQTAQETKFDPVSFEQRLLSNIRAAAQPPASAAPQPRSRATTADGPQRLSEPVSTNRAQREQLAARLRIRNARLSLLKTFPSEDEGRTAADLLRNLEPGQRRRLRELAEDELATTARGAWVGLGPMQEDRSLQAKNLVTWARDSRVGTRCGRNHR